VPITVRHFVYADEIAQGTGNRRPRRWWNGSEPQFILQRARDGETKRIRPEFSRIKSSVRGAKVRFALGNLLDSDTIFNFTDIESSTPEVFIKRGYRFRRR